MRLILNWEVRDGEGQGQEGREVLMAAKKKVMSASAAAKKARSGADMGAKGKNFSKVAAKAAAEYGSAAAGKKVAGAIFQKKRRAGTL